MRRVYKSDNVGGNLHDAARFMNDIVLKEHPEAELISAEYGTGNYSVIIYSIPAPESHRGKS